MNDIDFNEYLLLDETKFEDFQKAFYYLREYIEKFKQDFDYELFGEINILIGKFINFGNPIKEKLISDREKLIDSLSKLEIGAIKYNSMTKKRSLTTLQLSFREFNVSFLNYYNKVSFFLRNEVLKNNYLDLNGILVYNNSNKRIAIQLINDAIELIKVDSTISEKSKEKILKYLIDVISELQNPKTNWNIFFSKLTEIMIVLGSLGSIAGGIVGIHSLSEANDKLEEAKKTIIQTSINLNYQNIQKTLNINQNFEIKDNNILLISDD